MSMLEDQVRAALRARAEDFSADPDAWARIRARSLAARKLRFSRSSRAGRWLIPVAAGAAVVAIVVAAVAVGDVFGRATGAPADGAGATPTETAPAFPPLSRTGPDAPFLAQEPPTSAIVTLPVPSTHQKADAYFWLAYNSPAYWLDQIVPGLQFCHFTVNVSDGGGAGFCWPLPNLDAGHLASVTGNEGSDLGNGKQIAVGAAARQVRSVAAVLPDGRVFPGTIGTGRGFPYNAWAVAYPPSSGVRLVFRDAAGQEIAGLSAAAPNGPPQTPQPRSGGVPVFHYVGGYHVPSGTMLGYLIDGRVGFWSRIWGGEISQVPANGERVLGGLLNPFDLVYGGGYGTVEAFGYAHADVARVVLHLATGSEVVTSTFAAGWAGSDLRLWAVPLPQGTWTQGRGMPSVTATAEDATGHVLGQVQLGGMG